MPIVVQHGPGAGVLARSAAAGGREDYRRFFEQLALRKRELDLRAAEIAQRGALSQQEMDMRLQLAAIGARENDRRGQRTLLANLLSQRMKQQAAGQGLIGDLILEEAKQKGQMKLEKIKGVRQAAIEGLRQQRLQADSLIRQQIAEDRNKRLQQQANIENQQWFSEQEAKLAQGRGDIKAYLGSVTDDTTKRFPRQVAKLKEYANGLMTLDRSLQEHGDDPRFQLRYLRQAQALVQAGQRIVQNLPQPMSMAQQFLSRGATSEQINAAAREIDPNSPDVVPPGKFWTRSSRGELMMLDTVDKMDTVEAQERLRAQQAELVRKQHEAELRQKYAKMVMDFEVALDKARKPNPDGMGELPLTAEDRKVRRQEFLRSLPAEYRPATPPPAAAPASSPDMSELDKLLGYTPETPAPAETTAPAETAPAGSVGRNQLLESMPPEFRSTTPSPEIPRFPGPSLTSQLGSAASVANHQAATPIKPDPSLVGHYAEAQALGVKYKRIEDMPESLKNDIQAIARLSASDAASTDPEEGPRVRNQALQAMYDSLLDPSGWTTGKARKTVPESYEGAIKLAYKWGSRKQVPERIALEIKRLAARTYKAAGVTEATRIKELYAKILK